MPNRAIGLLAVALLSGCNQEPGPIKVADKTAEAIPAESAQMGPGLYAVGDGTQVYSRTRLNGDGSYVDLDDEGTEVGGGNWQERGERICFDPKGDGEAEQERCWINGDINADGSFTTTRDDGSESYTVTPLDE